MSLRDLLLISPPPKAPKEIGTPKAWEKIGQRLGVVLPQDYKDLIDHYGTGTFGDSIIILNPFAENESLNLFHTLETHHRATQMAQLVVDPAWTAIHPFELYPAHLGLLPWGTIMDYERIFFWQVNGAPDKWVTVFYNLRNGEYEVWKMPCTDLLVRLLSGALQSVLLPEYSPSNSKTVIFKSHPEVTL
jgi:hypothetical protein